MTVGTIQNTLTDLVTGRAGDRGKRVFGKDSVGQGDERQDCGQTEIEPPLLKLRISNQEHVDDKPGIQNELTPELGTKNYELSAARTWSRCSSGFTFSRRVVMWPVSEMIKVLRSVPRYFLP